MTTFTAAAALPPWHRFGGAPCAIAAFLVASLAIVGLDAAVDNPRPAAAVDPSCPLPVEGVVTQDGQPVAGAVVSFLPADDPGRRGAYGGTDASGRLRLGTFALRDGVLPGEYKVLVVHRAPLIPTAGWEAGRCCGVGPAVPAVYADPVRTPLRCKVPCAGGLILELGSTGGPKRRPACRPSCPGGERGERAGPGV